MMWIGNGVYYGQLELSQRIGSDPTENWDRKIWPFFFFSGLDKTVGGSEVQQEPLGFESISLRERIDNHFEKFNRPTVKNGSALNTHDK